MTSQSYVKSLAEETKSFVLEIGTEFEKVDTFVYLGVKLLKNPFLELVLPWTLHSFQFIFLEGSVYGLLKNGNCLGVSKYLQGLNCNLQDFEEHLLRA